MRNMRNREDFQFVYTGETMSANEQLIFFHDLHSQIINGHNSPITHSPIGNIEEYFELVAQWLNKRVGHNNNEEKQLRRLRELLEGLGWGKSILFSPRELFTYEKRISSDLKKITLVAANTTDDTKGGNIYPIVAENLSNGVNYEYIFFDYPGAKKQLESIFNSHEETVRNNLSVKMVKGKLWFCADILLIKIYDFKTDIKSEIFFRIKMATDSKSEQCIYIKGDPNKIPIIQQEIDDLLEENTVVKYEGQSWICT